MSLHNRVVWSEGMLLKPHHLQQHDRFIEQRIESRCRVLGSYSYGFDELELDHNLLRMGKVAIRRASGVFPDGTPFRIPDQDQPPPVLELSSGTRDTVLYLAIPVYRAGTPYVTTDENDRTCGLLRMDTDVYDLTEAGDEAEVLEVGRLKCCLLRDNEELDGFTRLAVTRVLEVRQNSSIQLDESFIPATVSVNNLPVLHHQITEIVGLLNQRAESLATRFAQAGQGGASAVADFIMLQMLNRYQALFEHYAELPHLHPLQLFEATIQLYAELSTFVQAQKRPQLKVHYNHDDLRHSMTPLLEQLYLQLSSVLEQTATRIPIKEQSYGVSVAPVTDRSWLKFDQFILAVKADTPRNELVTLLPGHMKIGPVEMIRQLVNNQLPGIGLTTLAVAPRQVPVSAGFVYFQLDKHSAYWESMQNSGGFAFHLAGNYPGLELEFWAIKE